MKKTVLVTGACGFVGPYLISELERSGYKVLGIDRSAGADYEVDLLDANSLERVFQEVLPDYICHLAGFSSVKDSFNKPELCKRINVEGTRNLLSAVKKYNSSARTLIISSAHIYGDPKYNPIDELHPLNPNSPYAESRMEQEKLSLDSGLDVIISRSFNHTGPGQQKGFVCPDFICETRELLAGKCSAIRVGNLSAERDISDVRDVVHAYRLLLENGVQNEIYNVCSGRPVSIQHILDSILKLAGIDSSKVVVDSNKFRPVDVPIMYGDNSKLKQLGWNQKYGIEKTLRDMWEEQIKD